MQNHAFNPKCMSRKERKRNTHLVLLLLLLKDTAICAPPPTHLSRTAQKALGSSVLEQQKKIDQAERVVVISTAHGLKFADFKVRYHNQQLEFPCRHANRPIELAPRIEEVKKALDEALRRRGGS